MIFITYKLSVLTLSLLMIFILLIPTAYSATSNSQELEINSSMTHYIAPKDYKKIDKLIYKLTSPTIVFTVLLIFAIMIVFTIYLLLGFFLFVIFFGRF